jgi:hypothetical protein
MEILVHVKDPFPPPQVTPDNYRGALKGDVIACRPDGWVWGECEQGLEYYTDHRTGERRHHSAHPNGRHLCWRIIKLPNVVFERLHSTMMGAETLSSPDARRERRFRGFHVDLENLPDAVRAHIADDSRAEPHCTHHLSHDAFVETLRERNRGRRPTEFGDPNAGA